MMWSCHRGHTKKINHWGYKSMYLIKLMRWGSSNMFQGCLSLGQILIDEGFNVSIRFFLSYFRAAV